MTLFQIYYSMKMLSDYTSIVFIMGMAGGWFLHKKILAYYKGNPLNSNWTDIERAYQRHKKYDDKVLIRGPKLLDNFEHRKRYHDIMTKFYGNVAEEENGVNIFEM